jgi:hypothetical protein
VGKVVVVENEEKWQEVWHRDEAPFVSGSRLGVIISED